MIKQGFYIGRHDWWVMAFYDVNGERDLNEVYGTLLACGCSNDMAQRACMTLSQPNSGYTFTNLDEHTTVMAMAKATSHEQMFDTVVHEMKHLVEHISDYYGLNPKTEMAAYLQGEVGRKMFPAAAIVMCPNCGASHR